MSFRGTTATFFRRSDGALMGYRVEGHTGYASAGEDIVCAAVSALTQAVLNGLDHVLGAPVRFRQDDAQARIEAELLPEIASDQLDRAQILLVTLLEGLQAIQRDYPRNIRVLFKEWR